MASRPSLLMLQKTRGFLKTVVGPPGGERVGKRAENESSLETARSVLHRRTRSLQAPPGAIINSIEGGMVGFFYCSGKKKMNHCRVVLPPCPARTRRQACPVPDPPAPCALAPCALAPRALAPCALAPCAPAPCASSSVECTRLPLGMCHNYPYLCPMHVPLPMWCPNCASRRSFTVHDHY